MLAGAGLSALLLAAYARGAWPLAFVVLVPWLAALGQVRDARGALLASLAMAVGWVGAAFGWFAPAVAGYTGMPTAAAAVLLLAAAPLLQPQLIAFALVRHVAARRHGPRVGSSLAVAAWIAVEWAVPRVFGDTLAYGLHPSRLLRQGADVAGAIGLTAVVLVANEAIAIALARRRSPIGAVARPLALALAMPLLLAGYGAFRLAGMPAAPVDRPLRVGLVQAAVVDYERLRREHGAYAVVRGVLDTHYALSMDLRGQGADALVWPETVYPTTFGQPRSEAGAELDRELTGFAMRAGVPLVFGTYARDAAGEYNVAAFIDPVRGPLGAYRKTRLFPLTEYVPPAIDGPWLRRALPWAGTWRPGDGARVFPLVTADGREIPVAPLICRDDVDPGLGRDAARLGAQLLVGLSNDAWFTHAPLGAHLHLAAAAFRSVETRLPQVRATTNGVSAVIDSTGEVLALTRMGPRTTLLAEVDPRAPEPTAFVRWGQWIGPLSALVLLGAGVGSAARTVAIRRTHAGPAPRHTIATALPSTVLVLRPWQRATIGALRAVSRGAVLVLGIAALAGEGPPRMIAQLRDFSVWVLAPELAAAALAWACTTRLRIGADRIVLASRHRRIAIDRASPVTVRTWRWPWPCPGLDLERPPGRRWTHGIASWNADAVARALVPGAGDLPRDRHGWMLETLAIARRRIDHPAVKFGLFALVPALPAFRLHQLIAYGGVLGEYYTFGARAWLSGLLLWWASWAVTLVLIAGGLRMLVEIASAATLALRPRHAPAVRRTLLGLARLAYFVGVPAWLAVRMLGG